MEGEKIETKRYIKALLFTLLAAVVILVFVFIINRKTFYTGDTALPRQVEHVPVDMVFVGDIMLDRGVAKRIAANGVNYIFSGISRIFDDADVVLGNLEGTITRNESISQKDNSILRFTFATSTALTLRGLGFTGVSLANNHALDFGEDGFVQTLEFLRDANIFSFGSPRNTGHLSEIVQIKGESICFVGYHELFTSDATQVINEIERLDPECDYLSVFAHWGIEYQDNESESQRMLGHSFIDAGADAVIGGHPHVVQPIELYKEKPIFYSLGNFVFDQDFSLETQQGLAVRVTLDENSVKYHLIPVEMNKSRLYFPEKESFQDRMDILISKLPDPLRQTADIDNEFVISR